MLCTCMFPDDCLEDGIYPTKTLEVKVWFKKKKTDVHISELIVELKLK